MIFADTVPEHFPGRDVKGRGMEQVDDPLHPLLLAVLYLDVGQAERRGVVLPARAAPPPAQTRPQRPVGNHAPDARPPSTLGPQVRGGRLENRPRVLENTLALGGANVLGRRKDVHQFLDDPVQLAYLRRREATPTPRATGNSVFLSCDLRLPVHRITVTDTPKLKLLQARSAVRTGTPRRCARARQARSPRLSP